MISFTYGDKISRSAASNKAGSNLEQDNSIVSIKQNDETSSISSSTTTPKKENSIENEYDIKGKDWFFVPDYAGEAASAVKLQCLQILSLTEN